MKISILSILVSTSALALAQDLAGLPTCAQTAAINGATSSGCGLTNAECLCKNDGFIESLRDAISTACTSAADQQAACTWGNSACSAFGVSIPCTNSAPSTPVYSDDPVSTKIAPNPENTPASEGGSSVSTIPSDAAGSPTSSMSMPSGSGMSGSMSTSIMPSMTSVSSSMAGMMNATHTGGNVTHLITSKPSTTSAGPTSHYTGAGNAAVRHSGIIGTVFGVAMLFAFF